MAGTRDRLITATGELFRRQGYRGTSIKQVTTAAGAPTGSLFHFFPGGKDDLADTVLRSSGGAYRELFEAIYAAATDPPSAITDFFDGAALVLEETDYLDACPIGTVALEVASTNDRLRATTAEVFESWVDAAATHLRAAGVAPDRARDVATTLVAAVEGGFMLSRAARSPEPMRAAGRLMREVVEATVASSSPHAISGTRGGGSRS